MTSMGKTFFISDLHFNHENIISFDKRPFRDKTHMFYSMIARWNDIVSPEDTVYILGDFAWDREAGSIASILKKLNGTKHMILGNHDACYDDKRVIDALNGGTITTYKEIEVDDKLVVLSHFPIASWKHMQGDMYHNNGTIHLYGHVHMTDEFYLYEEYLQMMRDKKKYPMEAYNVGAMLPYMNYAPKTLEEIISGYHLLMK